MGGKKEERQEEVTWRTELSGGKGGRRNQNGGKLDQKWKRKCRDERK